MRRQPGQHQTHAGRTTWSLTIESRPDGTDRITLRRPVGFGPLTLETDDTLSYNSWSSLDSDDPSSGSDGSDSTALLHRGKARGQGRSSNRTPGSSVRQSIDSSPFSSSRSTEPGHKSRSVLVAEETIRTPEDHSKEGVTQDDEHTVSEPIHPGDNALRLLSSTGAVASTCAGSQSDHAAFNNTEALSQESENIYSSSRRASASATRSAANDEPNETPAGNIETNSEGRGLSRNMICGSDDGHNQGFRPGGGRRKDSWRHAAKDEVVTMGLENSPLRSARQLLKKQPLHNAAIGATKTADDESADNRKQLRRSSRPTNTSSKARAASMSATPAPSSVQTRQSTRSKPAAATAVTRNLNGGQDSGLVTNVQPSSRPKTLTAEARQEAIKTGDRKASDATRSQRQGGGQVSHDHASADRNRVGRNNHPVLDHPQNQRPSGGPDALPPDQADADLASMIADNGEQRGGRRRRELEQGSGTDGAVQASPAKRRKGE